MEIVTTILQLGQKVSFDIHDFTKNQFPKTTGHIIALELVETDPNYRNTYSVKVKCDKDGKIYKRSWNGVSPINDC